jgi:HlyD family secretion protein
MDRPLHTDVTDAARRRSWLRGALLLTTLVAAFLLLRGWVGPGVDRKDLTTSVVERGDVQATITASGVVKPRDELVISAGFASEVLEAIASAGRQVEKDQPILVLDSSSLQVEIQDLSEKLALKENERTSAGLRLEQATNEARGRFELRRIDLESRQARLDRYSVLAKDGLVSKGELLEAQLDVRRTSVELAQLEEQMTNQRASNEAELQRIALEASILQNQLDEKRRLLGLTTVRAPRAGVVTWLLDEIGASVAQGQPLVRIADLSAFEVEATLSDFYAAQLQEGLPVVVDVSGTRLDGSVKSVLPTVENGAMRLLVQLDDPAAGGLRPQLRVNVDVITGLARDTLRLRRGIGLGGTGRQQLYRIRDGVATRTAAQLGLSNRDYFEVIDGLAEGDEIIVSDNEAFSHLESLEVD